ncbi:molybdenum cofactor guanylyltransferase [Rhizorhabdus dicambivorans]|uniref:Molybdenum cofactor guanylyltransferase n=1 Tax=Rhizorhabdus dicambivorans TaxID=1850238 RepID=A0A2A4FTP0_9SPHN|nr:molybdenum cofactor guanylyltransferase [Rhizorhabdus dicambivorans]ATE66442.1 molybdenum cofactor guanylyltransferase [Rhizorhabdus dicambivorans]PCE41066.1 molybdenum cofactor guanylyltransferase [Rhizorhabdus dicambivorans]
MSRLGAVIAGGRSSRFGTDKAEALWQGRPLIDHAIDALRPFVDEIVVCGRAHGGLPVLADRPAPDMGPLGGINAALHHGRERGDGIVLTVGCDTPLLPAALFERLIAAGGPAYVAQLPLIGCWPTYLATGLDGFLASDAKHAIRAWAALAGAEAIDWPGLANINEPGDLAALPSTSFPRKRESMDGGPQEP